MFLLLCREWKKYEDRKRKKRKRDKDWKKNGGNRNRKKKRGSNGWRRKRKGRKEKEGKKSSNKEGEKNSRRRKRNNKGRRKKKKGKRRKEDNRRRKNKESAKSLGTFQSYVSVYLQFSLSFCLPVSVSSSFCHPICFLSQFLNHRSYIYTLGVSLFVLLYQGVFVIQVLFDILRSLSKVPSWNQAFLICERKFDFNLETFFYVAMNVFTYHWIQRN